MSKRKLKKDLKVLKKAVKFLLEEREEDNPFKSVMMMGKPGVGRSFAFPIGTPIPEELKKILAHSLLGRSPFAFPGYSKENQVRIRELMKDEMCADCEQQIGKGAVDVLYAYFLSMDPNPASWTPSSVRLLLELQNFQYPDCKETDEKELLSNLAQRQDIFRQQETKIKGMVTDLKKEEPIVAGPDDAFFKFYTSQEGKITYKKEEQEMLRDFGISVGREVPAELDKVMNFYADRKKKIEAQQ